jgi:hypothetical protein
VLSEKGNQHPSIEDISVIRQKNKIMFEGKKDYGKTGEPDDRC